MKKAVCCVPTVVMAVFAGSSFGYEWSSGSKPGTLGDGAVTIEYAADAVSGFKIAGGWLDTNVLTGDDITFADGGTVTMQENGSFTFQNKVVSEGSLIVSDAKPVRITYAGLPLWSSVAWAEKSAYVLFQNVDLDDYEVESSNWKGGSSSAWTPKFENSGLARPYFQDPSATVTSGNVNYRALKFQLQQWDGAFTRCVVLSLFQKDVDVYGVVHSAKCVADNLLGVNVEEWSNHTAATIEDKTIVRPTSSTIGNGFGVDQITLRLKSAAVGVRDSEVAFVGGLEPTGTGALKVERDAHAAVKLTGDSALPVRGDGTLKVLVEGDVTMSGAIGSGQTTSTNRCRVVYERPATDTETDGLRTVSLSGVNTSEGGVELVAAEGRPLEAVLANINAIPTFNGFTIGPWTSLRLIGNPDGMTGWTALGRSTLPAGRDLSTVTVLTNGTLVADKGITKPILARKQPIILDGGCLRLRDGEPDSRTYAMFIANDLTFKNGAFVTNAVLVIGGGENATWKVLGSVPSRCDRGVALLGHKFSGTDKKYDVTFTIDVADVTRDSATDFTLGAMYRYGTGFGYSAPLDTTYQTGWNAGLSNNVAVVKTGAGTLELTKDDDSHFVGPLTVKAGVLRLGGSKTIDQSVETSFAGGSLAVAANCTNIINKLSISANTTFTLESGACLTIKAIDTWSTEGVSVVVDANLSGKCLNFGSDETKWPTDEQLATIRTVEGHKVKLDEDGWLRDASKGVIIIFR